MKTTDASRDQSQTSMHTVLRPFAGKQLHAQADAEYGLSSRSLGAQSIRQTSVLKTFHSGRECAITRKN